jgi:putative NADPH-quinone reductase
VDLALVVIAPLSADERELRHAAAVRQALQPSMVVETIDLVTEGVTPAMSRTERLRYHSDTPVVDPQIETHADLVARASLMAFVFPTEWWSPPPVLKAWIERTFVPGIAFVLDEQNRVRPHLTELRTIVGVTTRRRPELIANGGDGARRLLLRTMRLNVPRRVRSEWLIDPDEATITARVGRL